MGRTRANPALIFLLLAAALVLVIITVGALPRLGEIPWTQHAQNSHTGEWNVTNILPRIEQKGCFPIVIYSCPRRESVIYTCPATPGSNLWIGLIIGTANDQPVVVTGFAAKAYWED